VDKQIQVVLAMLKGELSLAGQHAGMGVPGDGGAAGGTGSPARARPGLPCGLWRTRYLTGRSRYDE
jgi:hypothetical protein